MKNWIASRLSILVCLFMLLPFSNLAIAEDWNNGVGVIKEMFVYPDFVVVTQGNSRAGEANCVNNGRWSFQWSQFDGPTQQRVMSLLLTAYTTQSPINAVLVSNECGPEGLKKFTGKFHFAPK